VAARAILLVIEERKDGGTIEGAMENKSLDEGESDRVNHLPTRPRRDSTAAEDAPFDNGGSSEGSIPASSCGRDESAASPLLSDIHVVLLRKGNHQPTSGLGVAEARGSQGSMTSGQEARECLVLRENLPRS
jgi:hypothetical protein